MAKPETKGKIVSFKAAREAASGTPMPSHAPEKQPPASPSKVGGYAEVWLKANTDKDALIKENLALKKHQKELEAKYETLTPTLMERALYYVAVLGIILSLLTWAGILVMKGL